MGLGISYLEAAYMVSALQRDPESWFHAEVADWEFPITREWLVLADIWNQRRGKRSKLYPRPYKDQTRYGGRKKNKVRRSPAEVWKILRPNRPLPPGLM